MKLFEASGLSKRFGAQVVLQDITLSFEEGQLNGIMGPNGAGKTTCFNVLTGRYKPDRGRVTFAGEDITGLSPREIARKGVSRSFQIMNLFDSYTALDNVLVATPHVRRQGFNPWRDLGADSTAQQLAAAILERVGLKGKERTLASSLSYGERRALEIGVALAAEPRMLFLDEPTAGLGAEGTAPHGAGERTQAPAHHCDHRTRHELSLQARRPDLGHPLGPGHQPRARPTSCGRTNGCAAPTWERWHERGAEIGDPGRRRGRRTCWPWRASTLSTAKRRCCSTCR